ncbi:unnamed protein product [Schistosoma bovis]|nr:unnamed protein product [Schistosoma bovis]
MIWNEANIIITVVIIISCIKEYRLLDLTYSLMITSSMIADYPRRQPKLICTQRDGIIQCYYVNKGTSIQRFNGKGLLWSLLTLNFIYLLISKYW